MSLTTNAQDERKGSDGLHFAWNSELDLLELYFAEAKIWNSFAGALTDVFSSIETFHSAGLRQHELNLFSAHFRILDLELQKKILSYVNGKHAPKTRMTHACLLGFDWSEYNCLDDMRRRDFVAEFEDRYSSWAVEAIRKLETKLASFPLKHLRFEFFFLPFKSVADFRQLFEEALRG
jgi:hypothetical protein